MSLNKKRKKNTRHRGTHTHSRGAKKKARGSGHRGGIGMAGSGKRGDQKKTLVLKLFGGKYFGKRIALRKKILPKLKTINLYDLSDKAKGQKELEMKGYKILGQGEMSEKVIVIASAASKSAIEKVKKAGGEIKLE